MFQTMESFDHIIGGEPIEQFKKWFETASASPNIIQPDAMCLATATKDGKPSCRIVLLKGVSESGFEFCTNYESRKGMEIAENPCVSLNFFWEPIRKVVRVEGRIEKLSPEESLKYHKARPIGSQIAATISPQSQIIQSGESLLTIQNEMLLTYPETISRPANWGGFIVIPDVIEFWQGHQYRIHHRTRFRKLKDGELLDEKLSHRGENGWIYEYLAP